MPKKYVMSVFAVIMTLSIALAAGLHDGYDISLTSPKGTSTDQSGLEKSAASSVVWDNGMAYVGLVTSQQESVQGGLDSEPADDFTFAIDQLVNDVHWIGGYWNGPPDDGDFDWVVKFYDDDGTGTRPGNLIASFTFANAAVNETFIGTYYYSYSADLPSAMTFLAGTKYWISIQGQGDMPPQSGWAYHTSPIILHEAVIRSVYFGLPDWVNMTDAIETADMCFQLTAGEEEACSWNPGDPHKMHFPQLPDEDGWDVNATYNPNGGLPMVLADDFMCMQDGPITDIHFWGSWKDGIEGEIISFVVGFAADIPADQNPDGYSMPGVTFWEREVTAFGATPKDPPTTEGWYDPAIGEELWNNHQAYFQYDICFDPDDPDLFVQDSGTIYWLFISAIVADPTTTTWGWKSTQDHWNDDAVWAFWGELNWIDIWEPAKPLVNPFFVSFDFAGAFIGGGGEGYYGEGWYYYPTDWWNIWFYDHPFDSTRRKYGVIDFDVFPLDPGMPGYVEIAVNWSTPQWSIDFPEDSMPPLPGVPEELYVGRMTLFLEEYYQGHYTLPYELPDFNPEWVSVDVRGYNFEIPAGIIEHTCQGSLDLAFVITGEEPPAPDSGACCYDPTGGSDHSACIYTTETTCGQVYNGTWEGAGVQCEGVEACCLPNGDCVMADALCCVNELGGTPQGAGSVCTAVEACCFSDGTCQDLDPLCCLDQGGAPQGPGSSCSPVEACCFSDGSCRMLSPECCDDLGGTPQGAGSDCSGTVACCMPDGTCETLSRVCCDEAGGTPSPIGAPHCLGDLNGDSHDDACYIRDDLNWQQPPDIAPTGVDVDASCPSMAMECVVLADDFLCTKAGAITEIHIYGSWYHDMYPIDPGMVSFTLSIHSDVPAGIDRPWSHPGEILWMRTFQAGEFQFRPFAEGVDEGFYSPIQDYYEPIGDHTCWEYIFYIPEEAFIQQGSELEPVVYWLDVQARPEVAGETFFGWKTSFEHWNDDAVWAMGIEPLDPLSWMELHYIPPHPWAPASIDLAFDIYGKEGGPCDCIPGDANGDGILNVGDAVYLINYVFKSGFAPTPYPICSGDANCDCIVNVGDAVYMINYVFKSGQAPCDCPTWLSRCGPPLRK